MLNSYFIDELEKKYSSLWPKDIFAQEHQYNPFKLLVLAILSQNTSEINSNRAYKSLAEKFEIKPEVLKNADEKKIREAIKIGGIHKIKAKRIRTVSKEIMEEYNGDLRSIFIFPKKDVRNKLMELSGVGNKTADIVLTGQYSYREVIPIDTHMKRIAKRLGLVKQNAKYNEIQASLMHFIQKRKRERAARLLWLMAKYTCRARNPKCFDCLLLKICQYKCKNL